MGQDEGAASAVVVQPVTNQSGQIACRWCGLFSDPGPACDLCGSPLLDVPWLQVPQLMYRSDALVDPPQIIAPAAPPEAPVVALPATQPAVDQPPAPAEEAIQIAAPPVPVLDAESEEAQRRALLGRLWPREPSLDADVDHGPAASIIDVDLNVAPPVEFEETPAQPKPRWWRRGRKGSESDEEVFDEARTESLPEITEQVPLPPAAGDAPTPSEERASGGEKRSIIETVGSLADLEGEAADQAELQEQLRHEEEARLRAEELARLRAHEEARLKAEQEAVLKAELEARLRAEEKARLKAEEEARAKAEEETRRLQAEEEAQQAEEEARLRAEEVARQQAEEEARLRAEEAARLRAEKEARASAEKEARAKAEEQARADERARLTAAKEAKLRAKEEVRLHAEAEKRAKAEEAARVRAEEAARVRAEEAARVRAEEEARVRAEEEARVRADEQARAQQEARLRAEAEELARVKAEEEARLRADEEARLRADEEARLRAEEEARLRAEEQVRARDRAMGQADDGLRASLMQEMLGLGAERGSSNVAADAAATHTSTGAPAWSEPSTMRSVAGPQPQPEEKKRSKLPWRKSKRKRDETEGAGLPTTVPIGTSAAPRFQVPAVAPLNGAVYEVPPTGDPALAAPGAVFLVCSRCGQPSPGGGLCEACDDALSQLRQLTAALLDAGD